MTNHCTPADIEGIQIHLLKVDCEIGLVTIPVLVSGKGYTYMKTQT